METKYTLLIKSKGKVGGFKSDLSLEQAKATKKDILDDNRNRQVPVTVQIIIGSYEF